MKYKRRNNNKTRRGKQTLSRKRNKLVCNRTRKRRNTTKKNYQTGGDPSLVYDNNKLA